MIRSSSYRSQCPRGRHSALEEKQEEPVPFFVKNERQPTAGNGEKPFFQAKLNIGQPNDKYEQEADAVANKVVSQNATVPVVQQKEITGIQRLSSSREDEKVSTADARMLKDREIQEKPDIQRLATDQQEEKLGTNDQRMRRDKEIQTKPDIQRMCPGCEKENEAGAVQRKTGEKKEEEMVQGKSEGTTATTASSSLSHRIASSAGKGSKLSGKTMSEMSHSFGVDFSHVSIHTNNEAQGMNRELRAQAFTHGSDIYFNSGKYNPETSTGKRLLAHELTHVVQQGAAGKSIQRDCSDPEFCTPFNSWSDAARAEAMLRSIYLPSDEAKFGPESRGLYEDFLNRTPGSSLSPTIFSTAGNPVESSFASSWDTSNDVEAVLQTIGSRLSLTPGWPTASGVRIAVPISTYLSASEMNDRPINYSNPLSIAGHIAGGIGSSDAGNDYRKIISGTVFITRNDFAFGYGYTTVELAPDYEVFDSIDFCPGDCGTPLEQTVTIPMSKLEASGLAYDVPFQVNFTADSESETFIT